MLKLQSENKVPKPITIKISVQAMIYTSNVTGIIQKEVKDETLQPGQELFIPIVVPFSVYRQHMVHSDSMKVSVVVTDKQNPDVSFLAMDDIVLEESPCSLTMIFSRVRLWSEARTMFYFKNPINVTLTDCTLSLSGSGLLPDSQHKLPDLQPNSAISATLSFYPYKTGQRTLDG
ncbi:protein-glutamine gamma-glutamyltransferase E-like [Thalassophryne amazonica]|uniref:protein-glutamine gamma-glutamyltransferase E-like n=1 Tax=Thalassophryne amazonica TaxID=390379 RepID=UPI0014720F55|nr:protein-glutamine gamma-glutamyltransferase E-like [Thalassophryne amazonica]